MANIACEDPGVGKSDERDLLVFKVQIHSEPGYGDDQCLRFCDYGVFGRYPKRTVHGGTRGLLFALGGRVRRVLPPLYLHVFTFWHRTPV